MFSFSSDRFFSLFKYTDGHGVLVFRIGKTNEHETRQEVVFVDVRAMETQMWTVGLRIEEAAAEELPEFRSQPLGWIDPELHIDRLYGSVRDPVRSSSYDRHGPTVPWEGYVVAGNVVTGVDETEYSEDSELTRAMSLPEL